VSKPVTASPEVLILNAEPGCPRGYVFCWSNGS
jgi:hypothetical protein